MFNLFDGRDSIRHFERLGFSCFPVLVLSKSSISYSRHCHHKESGETEQKWPAQQEDKEEEEEEEEKEEEEEETL